MTETKRDADVPGNDEPRYYVAAGASAGGLQALDELFENMPCDSGMAFVVVQHLSPQHKSLMVELLGKRTRMPVLRAEDMMRVEPDTVYLIPPNHNLKIFQGKLMLEEQEPIRGVNLPIDIFFRSLAEDQGDKSIGIILSGTGSDGMRGVRAIKEAGGMVMVQDEDSAKFDGMPRSAISTGLADFILPPYQMPEQLMRFVEHPYMAPAGPARQVMTDEDNITRLFSLLRDQRGMDFTYYKQSTISRRIERRISVNQFDSLAEYVRHLERSPQEVATLQHEFLIGVTSLFRDSQAFDHIYQEVLPPIFASCDPGVRIWVAGCSTGEEAYSVAILCQEYMEQHGRRCDVKIFATDIDRNAIEYASAGVYPESVVADAPDDLVAKYFVRKGDSYEVVRSIREMVVFAPHNLAKDPPFTRINLLCCRNLLIYLQPVLQRKILSLFQFALVDNGFLFLGTSETVGEMADSFELLHAKWKVYRALHSSGRIQPSSFVAELHQDTLGGSDRAARGRMRRSVEEDRLLDRMLSLLSKTYVPPGVLVDEQLQILHVIGDVRDYFTMPPGRLSMDVIKMAAENLAIPLATAMNKVLKTEEELVYARVRLKNSQPPQWVNIRVSPLEERRGQKRLVAVFFEEVSESASESSEVQGKASEIDLGAEAEARVRDLEQELQYTKENLQATIEELETSNEELQATNEELLASNEELQSTNEELQSVNEELYTVNAEYQAKILELTSLTNDVDNMLMSTEIETIFLEEDLTVRKFTPAAKRVLHLLPQDIGRPINHFAHELEDIDLMRVIREVQVSHEAVEREVVTATQGTFLMRALPYRTPERTTNAVVLAFVDISELKDTQEIRKAEELQRKAREFAENIVNTVSKSLLVVNQHGQIVSANDAFLSQAAVERSQVVGRHLFEVKNGLLDRERLRPLLQELFDEGRAFHRFRIPALPDSGGNGAGLLLGGRPMAAEADDRELFLITIEEDPEAAGEPA